MEKLLEKVLEAGVNALVWLLMKPPVKAAVRLSPTGTLVGLQAIVLVATYLLADPGLLLSLPSSYPLSATLHIGIACLLAIVTGIAALLLPAIDSRGSKRAGASTKPSQPLVGFWFLCVGLLIWWGSLADSWILTGVQAGAATLVLAWWIPRVYRGVLWPVLGGVMVVAAVFLPRMSTIHPLGLRALRYSHLAAADLTGRDLRRLSSVKALDLTDAVLARADLRGADLHGALLNGADLRGANLCGVRGLNQAMLDVAHGDQFTRLSRPLRVRCTCTLSVAQDLPYADGPSPCTTACPAQQPDDACAE